MCDGRVSCSLGWLPARCVVEDGPQLLLFLHLLLKYWPGVRQVASDGTGFGAHVGRHLGPVL